MRLPTSRLGAIADAAMIVIALAIGIQTTVWLVSRPGALGQKPAARSAAARRPPPAVQRDDYRVGELLPPHGKLQLADSDKTLVLFLRSSCGYCTASMPFYRRLLEARSNTKTVRIVAVSYEPQEVLDKYLRDNKLAPDAAVSIPPAEFRQFRVMGTPTLILTDRGRLVRQIWIGQLPASAQSDVLKVVAPITNTRP
jgi:thiol-disulfide isomerase/thioredoxin